LAIERTLVQIRERSLVDLLDLALVVARRRPGTLGLAALAGIAPFAAINAWLFATFPDLGAWPPMLLWMAEAPFATAPLTVALGNLMFGQRPTPGLVARSLLRAAIGLVVVQGIFRVVLAFWITSRLFFANEIVLLERGKWRKLLGRGRDLASGRGGELFILGGVQVGVTLAFAGLAWTGVSVLTETLFAKTVTWDAPDGSDLAGWRFQAPIWLATAFFAVARFLTYIDQRIRLEGWEVELRLRGVGEALKEARRW